MKMNNEHRILKQDAWHNHAHGFVGYANAALSRVSYAEGDRILEVSSGSGAGTFRIATHVGASCEIVGVERSASAIRRAEGQRVASGFDNVIFAQRNAESDQLGGPYHHAFSLFGTMCFERPDHLLRNIRKALIMGGTYTQVVWRRMSDNPWAERTFRSVCALFGVAALPEYMEATGVFSLASADVVAERLTRAGFTGILLERLDCEVRIGVHLADAVDFTAGYGPVAQLLALLDTEAAARSEEIYAALAGSLLPFIRPDGVWVPSSAWLVGSVTSA